MTSDTGATVLTTEMKEQKFFFKKDKLTGEKRPTLPLQLPLLTQQGLLEALSDPKVAALALSLVNDSIIQVARDQINDETKAVQKQEDLDLSKLDIVAIANLPAGERRGGGISKETWEEFTKDYIEVMAPLTGKNAEQMGNITAIFVKRLQPIKTQKKVLTYVKEQLALWFTNSKQAEDFSEVYEFLNTKADTFLASDEEALLANL